VVSGANPDKIALLDNFCVGNPEDSTELGMLVETCKGIAEGAESYNAPFVSGKDSFYNYFETNDGPVSIPTTCLISGMGVVDSASHVTGASIRNKGSLIVMLGSTNSNMGGSVYARIKRVTKNAVPDTDFDEALKGYKAFHQAVTEKLILSAHDVSEGGLGVAIAEMAFSQVGGVFIDLEALPVSGEVGMVERLFSESPSRILIECNSQNIDRLKIVLEGTDFSVIGKVTADDQMLSINSGEENVLEVEIAKLKEKWKNVLTPYY
jgi:phosphoribosylformylglycinamidine synthase